MSWKSKLKEFVPPIFLRAREQIQPHWQYSALESGRLGAWPAAAYLVQEHARWQQFCCLVSGTGPLGIHPNDLPLCTDDPVAHNRNMSFGYVVGVAALGKRSLYVLDYGGGLGHHYILARTMFPELKLEYTCYDLEPVVSQRPEELREAAFCSTEAALLNRRFDLALFNSSLQYCEDWKTAINLVASATSGFVYVSDTVFVGGPLTFSVKHFGGPHGYDLNVREWFFSKQEFLDVAARNGLRLFREFILGEDFHVRGAPASGRYSAFLFRASGGCAPAIS